MGCLADIAPRIGKAHDQVRQEQARRCKRCKGRGHVQGGTGYFGYVPMTCPTCRGTGKATDA